MNSNKNKKRFLDDKYNRYVVIAVEIALLITVVASVCGVLYYDKMSSTAETTLYVLQNQQIAEDTSFVYGTQFVPGQNTADFSFSGESQKGNNNPSVVNTSGVAQPGNAVQQGNQGGVTEDASAWSTAQILSKASEAINKTKGYSNNLSVHHVETFNATVTECTGGSVVQSVANAMVGWVVEPVDETLNYSGGMATNSEGETVPVLLPKRGSFTLGHSGIAGASARTANGEHIINLNIVQESVSMYQVPSHNAAAIGYLDVSSFDLSFLTVDSADITYKGSSFELHMHSQGDVTYAVYRVPLWTKGSGHSGAICGSVTIEGEHTEQWTLSY
jgi:hypothetical protein